MPLNTDHRLTAEQLFAPDERKEETGRKKRGDQRDAEGENES